MTDHLHRFLFEHSDVRGHIVQLDASYAAVLQRHHYAPPIARLLGEFLAGAALLGTSLKFEGTLTLQARSERTIPLIMGEVTSSHSLRGIARGVGEVVDEHFEALLGGGTLALTLDPTQGARYQGVVPLDGPSLASGLETYFSQSEQLPTRFWLASDGRRAAGMMLQAMPASTGSTEENQLQWAHLTTLADTLTPAELLSLPATEVLHRLFHQEPLEVYAGHGMHFACTCSRERCERALGAVSVAEVEDLLREQGAITMNCEFCGQQYRFGRDDLRQLFSGMAPGQLH